MEENGVKTHFKYPIYFRATDKKNCVSEKIVNTNEMFCFEKKHDLFSVYPGSCNI